MWYINLHLRLPNRYQQITTCNLYLEFYVVTSVHFKYDLKVILLITITASKIVLIPKYLGLLVFYLAAVTKTNI
jgi:hypothetical protein